MPTSISVQNFASNSLNRGLCATTGFREAVEEDAPKWSIICLHVGYEEHDLPRPSAHRLWYLCEAVPEACCLFTSLRCVIGARRPLYLSLSGTGAVKRRRSEVSKAPKVLEMKAKALARQLTLTVPIASYRVHYTHYKPRIHKNFVFG